MAFNLLLRLIANPVDEEDKDVGSPLDDVGDEIDDESDIDFDVEDRGHDELDLSLNSSDDDDSEIRSNPSDTSSAESEFAWFDHCKTLKLSYLPLELVSVWVNLS